MYWGGGGKHIAVQYFFVIWVVKYGTGWGPPIGGCKSFLKVLWTAMTNWAIFFAQNPFPSYISNRKFFWDYIDMLGRDFERKNSSIGHSSPQHHPEWFTSAYRGSPPCAIFHNPDKKDILHSNVLPNLVLKVWTKVFDFMTKNQLNWSFQSVAPSRMIYTRL